MRFVTFIGYCCDRCTANRQCGLPRQRRSAHSHERPRGRARAIRERDGARRVFEDRRRLRREDPSRRIRRLAEATSISARHRDQSDAPLALRSKARAGLAHVHALARAGPREARQPRRERAAPKNGRRHRSTDAAFTVGAGEVLSRRALVQDPRRAFAASRGRAGLLQRRQAIADQERSGRQRGARLCGSLVDRRARHANGDQRARHPASPRRHGDRDRRQARRARVGDREVHRAPSSTSAPAEKTRPFRRKEASSSSGTRPTSTRASRSPKRRSAAAGRKTRRTRTSGRRTPSR